MAVECADMTNSLDILFINPPLINKSNITEVEINYRNIWKEWSNVLFSERLCEYSIHIPQDQEFLLDDEFAPIGLLILATVAKNSGYSTRLCDLNQMYISKNEKIGPSGEVVIESICENEIRDYLSKYNNPTFIVSTSFTHNINVSLLILKIAKKLFPNSYTMIGGVHATYLSNEILQEHPYVDMIIKGPCGINFKDIIGAIVSGKGMERLSNVSYRDGGKIKNQKRTKCDTYFKNYITPDLGLLDIKIYKKNPIFSIFTQFGCNFNCDYCVDRTFYDGKSITFQINEIKTQIENIFSIFGKKIIQINDDTFTFNRKRCEAVLELLKEENFDTMFQIQTRLDLISDSLLKKMRNSGIHFINYGVENICNNVLRGMHRKYEYPQIEDVLRKTKEKDIVTGSFWMIGLPGETQDTINQNRESLVSWLTRGLIDLYELSVFVPYPGTPIFYNPSKYKLQIYTYDYSKYREDSIPVYRYDHLSESEIYSKWLTTHGNATEAIANRCKEFK